MTSGFNKLRISLIGTLLLTTIFPLAGHGGPIGGRKTAGVSGTVFDPLGAVVVNAEVSVRGASDKTETATNGEGKYEIVLPPGIYSLDVRSPGFCRAHRASFNVRPQAHVKFDFTLLACPSHGPGPMSYASFTLKSGSSEPSDFLIHFGKRTDSQDTIDFEGAVAGNSYYDSNTKVTNRPQSYVRVVLTYDCWTISANHLTLSKRTLRMELSGDVTIFDGVQERRAKSAVVDFALSTPIANVKEL